MRARTLFTLGSMALLGLTAVSPASAQGRQGGGGRQGGAAPVVNTAGKEVSRPYRPTYASTGKIEVIPVQGNVYMLAGAGANIAVQVGQDAVMVVDTNEAAMSDQVLAAIKTITPLPIRYIINTSGDPDHIGGNEKLANSAAAPVNAFLQQGARVFANENAYARMSNPKDGSMPVASGLWPTDAFASSLKSLYVTHEPVEIHHPASAHTDGDLMVFFRKSDVIATGDVFVTNGFPVIDAKRGGTLAGTLAALNQLIDLAIPEYNSMGGTRVIPGHGRICNEIDLVEYRDALTIIGDRITQLVLDGKTVDQVKAAGVTLDYDGVFGSTTGSWTTDMFVQTVYNEIKANQAPWRARLTRNVPIDDLQQVSAAFRPAVKPGAAAAAAKAAAAAAKRASADPLDGKWAMDTFVSKYEPVALQPYRKEMTLTFNGDELTHYTATWRRQGNASPLSTSTYTSKFDGKEYGIPRTSTKVTWKRIDANTLERVTKADDNSTETATWTLSADKKTLTIVSKGTDPTGVAFTSTQVFQKQ